jgi:hypothetical protein
MHFSRPPAAQPFSATTISSLRDTRRKALAAGQTRREVPGALVWTSGLKALVNGVSISPCRMADGRKPTGLKPCVIRRVAVTTRMQRELSFMRTESTPGDPTTEYALGMNAARLIADALADASISQWRPLNVLRETTGVRGIPPASEAAVPWNPVANCRRACLPQLVAGRRRNSRGLFRANDLVAPL